MEQRTVTGQYRLDANAQQFFGAPTLHFRQVEQNVLGRFGRRGTLKGTVEEYVLRARWKNDAQAGWLVAKFDAGFASFQGQYGVLDDDMENAALGSFSARRDVRKRVS
jgi:hypothetical protein